MPLHRSIEQQRSEIGACSRTPALSTPHPMSSSAESATTIRKLRSTEADAHGLIPCMSTKTSPQVRFCDTFSL